MASKARRCGRPAIGGGREKLGPVASPANGGPNRSGEASEELLW